MGLTMGQRKAVTREMANRYRRAMQATDCGDARSVRQAARLHPPPRGVGAAAVWASTVLERRRSTSWSRSSSASARPRRQSRRIYDDQVLAALRKIWYLCGCLCGKRLVADLRTQVQALEKFGQLSLDSDTTEAPSHQRLHHRPVAAHRETRPAHTRALPYQADHAADSTRSPSAASPSGMMPGPSRWAPTWSDTTAGSPAASTPALWRSPTA